MNQPKALNPDTDFTQAGKLFDTPVVVVGKSWLPVTELIAWGIAMKKKRWFIGAFLSALSAIAFGVGLGLLKEN